jgi:hypothetical protein
LLLLEQHHTSGASMALPFMLAVQAHAWLAFAQASANHQDQLAGRKAALASLENRPLDQVCQVTSSILQDLYEPANR